VALEPVFWRVAGELGQKEQDLALVVLLFPLSLQTEGAHFSFGRYLRFALPEGDGAASRFRRLLDSRDRDELGDRLRVVLKLASRVRNSVDWGVLGRDILWFFADSGSVRRNWAQDFYAPQAALPVPGAAP